jgi:hypothetical protein
MISDGNVFYFLSSLRSGKEEKQIKIVMIEEK